VQKLQKIVMQMNLEDRWKKIRRERIKKKLIEMQKTYEKNNKYTETFQTSTKENKVKFTRNEEEKVTIHTCKRLKISIAMP
jgi:arylamine N-acetyltransferase